MYRPSSTDFLIERAASSLDAFKVFMTDEVVDLVLEQSRLYASQKGCNDKYMSYENVMTMLRIVRVTGYVKLPDRVYITGRVSQTMSLLALPWSAQYFWWNVTRPAFPDNSKMSDDLF